jgi:hypothetical protein
MKRTPLFLTIGSVIFIIAVIFFYRIFFEKSVTAVWDIIPEETVLVYEVGDCEDCYAGFSGTVIGELANEVLLPEFPQRDSVRKALEFLFLPKKGSVISLHQTSKNDFDFVFYFPKGGAGEFSKVFSRLRANRNIRFSERVLNGSAILEYTFGGKTFSWVELGGIGVGSFTPFLIEDVVRVFEDKNRPGFSSQITEVFALPKINNDPGNFYIQLGNFMNWLGVFESGSNEKGLSLGQASLLDIKQSEGSITLNGFSMTRKGNNGTLLSYFDNQSPVQFTLKKFISNRSSIVTNYGISDGGVFFKNLAISQNQDSLLQFVKIDFQDLFSSFGNEMAICYQEDKSGFSKVLVFETTKPEKWLNYFDKLSKTVEREDTIFYERYSDYEIREIELRNLPGKLFAPLTTGFEQSYYTSIDNVILMSDKLEEMKRFLDDIDREDVWGKSVSFNKFLESTLLESNISVYINSELVWGNLIHQLNPRWRSFITTHPSLIRALGLGAIQFSNLNESFYTNIILEYSKLSEKRKESVREKSDKLVASLPSAIISRPFIIRSHVSKNDEVLVQDSSYTLYHISDEGKILWSKGIEEPIVGDVRQVDFFGNGKLQFFFATRRNLHVIDRLGNYVNPYPFKTPANEIEYSSVVDYDNSKKYRFLIGDKSGKLWMFDKTTSNLDGWKPNTIEAGLYAAANHHRIRGKDYILAIRKDGYAHLMNRRGEYIKGFPLNLDARPEGNYYVEIGNSLAETYFVCVSRDGFRIKFSLEGKILSKETLIKPSVSTVFSLIPERQGKSYIIARQDAKNLVLLNEEGAEILINTFVGTNSIKVQYYDFGAGKKYITVTDLIQDITFIYSGNGSLLTPTPVEGSALEIRPGSGDFPKIFNVSGNTLTIQ